MRDRFGRRIRYLRLSVTDRCGRFEKIARRPKRCFDETLDALLPDEGPVGNGPAVYYRFRGGQGTVASSCRATRLPTNKNSP